MTLVLGVKLVPRELKVSIQVRLVHPLEVGVRIGERGGSC